MSSQPKEFSTDLRLRDQWISSLGIDGKEETLFEFDMLLRGLDRFFNIENLFLNNRDEIAARDFADELKIISLLLGRLIQLSRGLLEQSEKNAYHFQRYIETELADDFLRDLLIEKSLDQESPRESLYLLFDALGHMQILVKELLTQEHVSFLVFRAIGEILRREILRNRFFNPLQSLNFSPTYDRIHSRIIRQIVTQTGHPTLQKRLSFVFLACFRLLHYLRFVNPRSRDTGYLKSSLLIFSLVRSEARTLLPYLEHGFKERLFDTEGNLEADEGMEIVTAELNDLAIRLASELDTLSYQMLMELRKVSSEELANAASLTRSFQLRGVVENAHGILTNLFQQAIVSLARVFEPEIDGTAIFPHFESRQQQSRRLLEDVLAFEKIMDTFEEQMETDPGVDTFKVASDYLQSLRRFLDYFKNETMLLLRFNDLAEFGEFFKIVHLLRIENLEKIETRDEFLARAKYFKIFVEATIAQIRQRQDLQGAKPNAKRIQNLAEDCLSPAAPPAQTEPPAQED